MLVPIEDHHLNVADLGRGTPLLLHDGWVASWELWLPLIEVLQHEWRCVAYDHRGTGASTFPAEAISASALVDDVFRVLDALGIDRCVAAGESLGCLVVEQAVLRDPSRFLGLVLVGGPTRGPNPPPQVAERIRADYPAYVDAFVSACLPEPDSAPLHRFGCATLLPAGPDAAIAMTAAHVEVAPALEGIAVPTLVVHGALDAIVPVGSGREAASRIPGADLVVLDDAGHVPIATRPLQVASAIDQWWSRVTADPVADPVPSIVSSGTRVPGPATSPSMLDPESVDLEMLAEALSDQGWETEWRFDPRTGETHAWFPDLDDPDEAEDEAREQLVRVEALPTWVWYQDMVDFAEGISDERAGRRLARALRGKGAFRRFKDELHEEYPELLEAWYAFRDSRSRRRAVEWLWDNDFVDQETRDRFVAAHQDPDLP